VSQTGFGPLETKRLRLVRHYGDLLGPILSTDPIRRSKSGKALVVESGRSVPLRCESPLW
jgi:hypothetical protein